MSTPTTSISIPIPTIEESLRIAGDIHKHVRRKMRDFNILVPGAKLIDIANFIETETKEYASIVLDSLGRSSTIINGGIGFPVGLSVNDCAAHYHPHSQDTHAILSNSDIVKVDFGTEVNGWIVDSAFTTRIGGGSGEEVDQSQKRTHCNSHSFSVDDCDSLISCMKDATDLGIRNIGIDVRISEWSASIEELIRSHEGVFPIYNLTGHDIKHEIIHGDVRLPSVYYAVDDKNERFKEGVYAIETFGTRHPKKRRASSSSNGLDPVYEVVERGESTIFRLNPDLAKYSAAELRNRIPIFRIQSVQKLFSQIRSRFRTLPFCERYMQPTDRTPVSLLVKNGILMSYPPLCTVPGSITAQFEHTVYVKDSTTIFSRDEDY